MKLVLKEKDDDLTKNHIVKLVLETFMSLLYSMIIFLSHILHQTRYQVLYNYLYK